DGLRRQLPGRRRPPRLRRAPPARSRAKLMLPFPRAMKFREIRRIRVLQKTFQLRGTGTASLAMMPLQPRSSGSCGIFVNEPMKMRWLRWSPRLRGGGLVEASCSFARPRRVGPRAAEEEGEHVAGEVPPAGQTVALVRVDDLPLGAGRHQEALEHEG